MKSKILLSFIALVLVIAPISHLTHADAGDWEPATAQAAWNYDEYKVERLMLDNTGAPQSFGDAVLVSKATQNGESTTVYQLKDGLQRAMTNVPKRAVDPKRFALNDERFVYVHRYGNNNSRFDLIEQNLQDGTSEVLAERAFFNDVEHMDVRVEGDEYFFNPTFNMNGSNTEFKQAVITYWEHPEDKAYVLGDRFVLHNENILDVHNGVVLVNMTFPSGHQELWLMDMNAERHKLRSIPGTWTEPHGEIVGAHFQSNGTVEYFQYFTRHTYDPSDEARPVKHEDETVTWFRDMQDSYQINNGRLAWIDHEDTLYLSDEDGVTELGTASFGDFHMENDRLFYRTAEGGMVYDIETGMHTPTSFYVTDTYEHVMVGNDPDGNIVYWNTETDQTMSLGFGTEPVLSDTRHAYWQGDDGKVYEGTVSPNARVLHQNVRAMKTADSPKVYLVTEDGARHYIPSEHVYASWFDSWNDIEVVSAQTLEGFEPATHVSFAPGTKVKMTDGPKVYLVGQDGKLHWIVSQTVAFRIFGDVWNKDIIEVTQVDLIDHARGTSILSERDVQSI